jgi:hypothetical protein
MSAASKQVLGACVAASIVAFTALLTIHSFGGF